MKAFLNGFILNIQFFSMIPMNKAIDMTHRNLRAAMRTLPLLGALFGSSYVLLLYMFTQFGHFSPLMTTFLLWLWMIVVTGGIHLDAWMDTSDAYFSYRDKQKRIEIMSDPHIGAFGVLSVIILLAAKFVFLYEIIMHLQVWSFLLIGLVPFFTRCMMGMVLAYVPNVKQKGLGYLFQQATSPRTLWFYLIYLVILFGAILILYPNVLPYIGVMTLFTIAFYFFFRMKVTKWFGGITGDIVGASQEGAEICLWIIIWLFHYSVMG